MLKTTVETGGSSVSIRKGSKGIWRHVRQFKGSLILVAFLGLVSAAANGFVPFVTGKFFDALIFTSQGETAYTAGFPYWALFLGLWALTRIISDSVDWWTDLRRRWITTYLHPKTQAEGFIHLLQLPLSFHTDEHINEMFSKISSAGWRMTNIVETIINVSPQFLSIIIGISLAFSINPTLASILAFGVLAYVIALSILLRGTTETDAVAHKAWNDHWNDAAAAVTQTIAVKQAAAEKYETERIRRTLGQEAGDLWYRNELLWSKVNLWQRIIVFLTQLSIFIVSVQLVASGVITVGELVALNGYALMFFGPLVMLGSSWQTIRNGLTAMGNLEDLFEKPTEIYHPKDARTPSDRKGLTIFENVSFQYDRGQEILSDISFTAFPGDSIAFVGESGVGKSTIISLISGYYFPTGGRVRIDDVDTRAWDLTALRSRIAVVPQEIALFNDTVRNNIRYGAFSATAAAVEQAARDAHIHDFIDAQPKKYDTLVGERGIKLSMGQKQRVAIARAMLRNPEILILDEPTSALDIETEQYIAAALEKLMHGRTTFIIAHRLSTIRKADKILVIKDGRVAEEGKHDELIGLHNGIYRHLYELHIGLHE